MDTMMQFRNGPARRPQPVVQDRPLQWATGLQTTDRRYYAGWLLETGRDPELDAAMGESGFSQVTIKHSSGNLVTHWAVETAQLYVVAGGVQTVAEMAQTDERFGIAFGWKPLASGRQQSQLRFRAFLRELLMHGYTQPLVVTAKSTITGDLITALTRQFEVLDACDDLRRSQGKEPLHAPYYACALPIGPGREVARGKTQTTTIIPPVALIPERIHREYLAMNWMNKAWQPIVESIFDETIRWSIETSKLLAREDASDGR